MCTTVESGSIVAVSESGRTFALLNPANVDVAVTKVDGCAITVGIRCDYEYELPSGREVFVELKGSDIKKAVQQIIASVNLLSAVDKGSRAAVVVASRVPKADTSTQAAKVKARKLFAKIVVRSGPRLNLSEQSIFS